MNEEGYSPTSSGSCNSTSSPALDIIISFLLKPSGGCVLVGHGFLFHPFVINVEQPFVCFMQYLFKSFAYFLHCHRIDL